MQKDKQLTPKLVTAIFSAGIMAFAGVVAETAMNITFPTLMREFGIGRAVAYHRLSADACHNCACFRLAEK